MENQNYTYLCITVKKEDEFWEADVWYNNAPLRGKYPHEIMQIVADDGGELISAQYAESFGGTSLNGPVTNKTHVLWVKMPSEKMWKR